MIEQLAQKDSVWRKMSFQICKDKDLANDIVQDMYIKLYNKNYQISEGLIYVVLNSLFLDIKRKKNYLIELDDNYITEIIEYDIEKDLQTQKALDRLPKELQKLEYYEKELLVLNQSMSQKTIAEQSEISFRFINTTIKKTKEKLCQNLKK